MGRIEGGIRTQTIDGEKKGGKGGISRKENAGVWRELDRRPFIIRLCLRGLDQPGCCYGCSHSLLVKAPQALSWAFQRRRFPTSPFSITAEIVNCARTGRASFWVGMCLAVSRP